MRKEMGAAKAETPSSTNGNAISRTYDVNGTPRSETDDLGTTGTGL